jgi:hypothetical protein
MTEQMERLVAPDAVLEIASGAELTANERLREEQSASPAAVQAPVLITEAEVALGTAAAVPLRRTTGWLTGASHAVLALHRTLAGSTGDERRPPRHHPKRLRYLEDARMEREMDRL